MSGEPAEMLARAFGYPYPRVGASFLLLAGGEHAPIAWRATTTTTTTTTSKTVEYLAFDVHAPAAASSGDGELREGSSSSDGNPPTRLVPAREWASARLGVALGEGPGLASRLPVLAYGSNASPAQLARKFPRADFHGEDAVIPVLKARLADFDVVYAAHISSYGSITAALQHCPGVECEAYVTYLTPTQLLRMNATEGGYDLVRFPCTLHLDDGDAAAPLRECHNYYAKQGCLVLGAPDAAEGSSPGGKGAQPDSTAPADGGTAPTSDAPGGSNPAFRRQVALAAVPATNRLVRALGQQEMQRAAYAMLEGAGPSDEQLNAFARENIEDKGLRLRRKGRLMAQSVPTVLPGAVVVERVDHEQNVQ